MICFMHDDVFRASALVDLRAMIAEKGCVGGHGGLATAEIRCLCRWGPASGIVVVVVYGVSEAPATKRH